MYHTCLPGNLLAQVINWNSITKSQQLTSIKIKPQVDK